MSSHGACPTLTILGIVIETRPVSKPSDVKNNSSSYKNLRQTYDYVQTKDNRNWLSSGGSFHLYLLGAQELL